MEDANALGGAVRLAGTAFRRGERLGSVLHQPILSVLEDRSIIASADGTRALSPTELVDRIAAYRSAIRTYAPECYEELEGLARGARITLENAVFLQVRRELFSIRESARPPRARPEATGCTTLGVLRETLDGGVLAQTVDLPASLAVAPRVLHVVPSGSEPHALVLSFGALLGYLGVNSAGIAVCINMVQSGEQVVGVPPYLLVREFLRQSELDACLRIVEKTPRSSSRALTLTDGKRLLCIEMTARDHAVLEADPLLHTNHFRADEFASRERADPLTRRNSRARLERLTALWSARSGGFGCSEALSLLCDHETRHPICIHPGTDPRVPRTVAAVALSPSSGTLHLRLGTACAGEQQTFRLAA